MSRKQLALDLVINGLLPWIGYLFLQSQYGWSDYQALLAVTVFPGAAALLGIVRKGRPDLISGLSLFAIILSLALVAVSSDTRVLQIRESYITALMGMAFIVSSLVGRPLIWLLARHQAKSPEQKHALERPDRKFLLGRVNAVWGWSFMLEFGAKVWMIDNLPIPQVLALSPVMFYGVTAVTFLWTVWWLKGKTKQMNSPEVAHQSPARDERL